MKKKLFSSIAGSTLIELLIAVMITGLVVTAVAATGLYSVKNSSEANYRVVATNLGQQVIELARGQRQILGFPTFQSQVATGTYCLNVLPDPLVPLPAPASCGSATFSFAGVAFQRELTVESSSAEVRLEVVVSWTDGAQERSVELIQVLQNTNL